MHINDNGLHSLSPPFVKYVQPVMKDFGILLKQDRDEGWLGEEGRCSGVSILQCGWLKQIFVDSILQIVRSNVTNVVNVAELHYETMGVFHIEHNQCIFTPFNCTPILSIILPIWDVLAKLFETAIKITTQTH